MNPLTSGAFLMPEAGVKCLDSVWVVSPLMGMGGRTGLGRSPGVWPKALLALNSNPDKTTNAKAGIRNLFFLVIEDFFCGKYSFLKEGVNSHLVSIHAALLVIQLSFFLKPDTKY